MTTVTAGTATVLQLAVEWLDADDASRECKYTNSAMIERSILDAIHWAMKNGDTLVLDDLHNALSYVDGCSKACMDKFSAARNKVIAAENALAAAGWDVRDYHGIEALMHYLDDPLVESRMARILDRLQEYAE